MTSLREALEELVDPTFLDRAMRGEADMPEHQNCRSVMTFRYEAPPRRVLTLTIMYLTVAKYKTPWWRVRRRARLQSEINKAIWTGLAHGYFNPKVKDTL